jgi:MFS family permease
VIHALRAFRHRNFRLFFYGQSLSLIGSWIQQIAMSWLVYRMTGSPFLLGLAAFAGQFPILILAPLGGIWADRFDLRKLLLATQVLAMLQGLALALLTYTGRIQVWHIIVMATALGVIMALDTPLRQTFVPQMVPAKEDMPAAIAFNGFMQNAGRMIGPTIAGMLLIYFSEASCFLINGISKIAVIIAIFLTSVAPNTRPSGHPSLLRGLTEGIRYAWDLVPIRLLLPILALISFMATPYQTLLPIFAKETFSGGADTLGFLMGAAGFGSLLSPIYLASRRDVRGLTRVLLGGMLLTGVTLMIFAYSHLLWLSMVLIAFTGLGIILAAQAVGTIFQTIVEDGMRGRLMSFFTAAFLGIAPLGSLAAGSLAQAVGAEHTLFIGGACCVAGAIALWRQLPRLRANIRPIYIRLGIIQE